jgi:hypothetical protein
VFILKRGRNCFGITDEKYVSITREKYLSQ